MSANSGLYRGDYTARAKLLKANATPASICWRCKRTLAEHPRHPSGKRAYWTAGHLVDGDRTSPLALEGSTCNFRAGAELGRLRREPRSPNA